jgi:hypothetical protein
MKSVTVHTVAGNVRRARGDVYKGDKDGVLVVSSGGKETFFPYATAEQIVIEDTR